MQLTFPGDPDQVLRDPVALVEKRPAATMLPATNRNAIQK